MSVEPESNATAPVGHRPLEIRSASDGSVVVRLGAGWCEGESVPELERLDTVFDGAGSGGRKVVFEDVGLDRQDALVVSAILQVIRTAASRGFEVDEATLPEGIRKLIRISLAVPLHKEDSKPRENPISRLGRATVTAIRDSRGIF